MRQAIIGLSIFIGLQLAYVVVLLGVTMWEARQLDRPMPVPPPTPQPVSEGPSDGSFNRAA